MSAHGLQKGFSLIELLAVIAIIGILSAIAIPAYNEYLVKGNRRAAQAFMLDVANGEKQYLLDARAYTASLTTLGMTTPPEVSANYALSIAVSSGPPGFTVTATPLAGGRQAGDGTLSVSDLGVKSPANKW